MNRASTCVPPLLALLLLSLTANAQTPPASGPARPAPDPGRAALERRVKHLEQELARIGGKLQQSELEALVQQAEAESKAPAEQQAPAERTFLWGALALQKLNPEISVSADFIGQLVLDGDRYYAGRSDRSSMPIRELGLHLQHVLDPYSLFKSAICFRPWPDAGVELEEIYITWFGVVPSLSITVGRFRQTFGVVNRWHAHGLDQVDYPMALQQVLGHGGLTGSGLGLRWFMPPLWAHANELSLELTDGENETLYAGEYFSVPTATARLKSYYDLTENTYLELGLSGAFGFNNRRGVADESTGELTDEPWRRTLVAGADLTLHWSPLRQARYRSVTWRSEGFYVNKELPDASADGDGARHAWGFYSYIDLQLATQWFAGLRYDAARPTLRAETGDDRLAWDLVPYVTFWQSEFVYLRLEYRHGRNLPHVRADHTLGRRTDNRLLLQVDFAAGPHKHEKY